MKINRDNLNFDIKFDDLTQKCANGTHRCGSERCLCRCHRVRALKVGEQVKEEDLIGTHQGKVNISLILPDFMRDDRGREILSDIWLERLEVEVLNDVTNELVGIIGSNGECIFPSQRGHLAVNKFTWLSLNGRDKVIKQDTE
jgi:hypothetical protein